ncbi:L,D-transpeptidase [Phyllobacterium sophorae]|uniref:L,D-transpeptidase n=1 Tax=Phyllobacterium sophorae TaxID=1520277 RepID=UPI003CC96052
MHKIKLSEKYSWPESLHINQRWTIGQAMSSRCIRMANDDVKHLYANVDIGTKVIVLR